MIPKKFTVPTTEPQLFKNKFERMINASKLKGILSLELNNDSLILNFSSFGNSVLTYSYAHENEALTANLKQEKIAFLHQPFMPQVLKLLEALLEKENGRFL